MDFGLGTLTLGYLAGVLSTRSPCVLPLLPILVVSALAQSRFGLLALAGGLTLSFAAVGLFIGTLGAAVGLDSGVLRQGAAVLLMPFGLGAATPLVLIGSVSRETIARLRGRLLAAGNAGKGALDTMLLLVGLSILTGWDKQVEGWVVERSPQWLTNLTTRY